jgi:hypothetical protein
MSLTETFKLTVAAVDGEIGAVHADYLSSRKFLNAQHRFLADQAAGQRTFLSGPSIAAGATIETTTAALDLLKKGCQDRTRHLNALRRVLLDEAEAAADAAQPKLIPADEAALDVPQPAAVDEPL